MELNRNRLEQNEERTGLPGQQGYQGGGREGMNEQEFFQNDDPELTQVDLDENDLSIEEADDIEWEEPNRVGGEPNQ